MCTNLNNSLNKYRCRNQHVPLNAYAHKMHLQYLASTTATLKWGVILSLFYIVDKEDKVSSRLTTNQGFPHPCVYSREIYTLIMRMNASYDNVNNISYISFSLHATI